MTDEIKPESEQQVSPGATLKQARLSAGLSVNDLASKLYVKPAEIEAIESDVLDANKSRTFTKGYVKNYARIVGLNVVALGDAFDAFHNSGTLQSDNTKLQSFSKRVAKEANDNRWMMVTYFILLLFIGGFVLWYVQQPGASLPKSEVLVGEQQTPNGNTAAQTKQATIVEEIAEEEPLEPDSIILSDSAVLTQTQANNESQPVYDNQIAALNDVLAEQSSQKTDIEAQDVQEDVVNSLRKVDVQPIDATNLPEPVEPQDTITPSVSVVFTFKEDCWVEIIDASGEAIAYGVKKAGRVMGIEGVPPFNIKLGAPQVVSIVYDGEEVDMSGFSGRQIGKLVLPPQG